MAIIKKFRIKSFKQKKTILKLKNISLIISKKTNFRKYKF